MIGITRRSMLALLILLVGLPNAAQSAEPKPAPQKPRQWAILPSDKQSEVLADLLTVEVSQWENVQLLERTEIKRVLDELKLQANGLADAERALRFGKLSQAQALVLIETLPAEKSPLVRLRLVETGSGVKLVDLTVPSANLENDVAALASEFKRASAKLDIAAAERQLIGIAAIKSEEPGDALKPFCKTLTALVEGELQQQTNFVVLEREQLQRLIAEQNLTGVERALRSSAWLVEAGVRRTDGNQGLVITGRLHSVGSGIQHKLRVELANQNLVEARTELIRAIVSAIGQKKGAPAKQDVKSEAALFAQRRDWFQQAARHEEAAEMAEAALALAPNVDNFSSTIFIYHAYAENFAVNLLKSHEALPPALRLKQISVEWWRKSAPHSPERKLLRRMRPFEPHVLLPEQPESAEDRALRTELNRLQQQLFEQVTAEEPVPMVRLIIYLNKLKYAASLPPTGKEFANTLPGLLAAIDRELTAAKIPREFQDDYYFEYVDYLVDAIRRSIVNVQRDLHGDDEQEWERAEVLPLWRELANSKDEVIRTAGLYGLSSLRGAEATRSAEALVEIVSRWPLAEKTDRLADFIITEAFEALTDSPPGGARRLSRSLQRDKFIEQLLVKAEQKKTAAELVRYELAIQDYMFTMPVEQMPAFAERLLKQLEDPALTPDQRRWAGILRQNVQASLKQRNLYTPPEFTTDGGEGPWQEYLATPIQIDRSPKEDSLLYQVHVDHRIDAHKYGGEIVLVWTEWGRKLYIERIGLAGGTPKSVGVDIPGSPRAFTGVQLAYHNDTTFVASGTDGFTMLKGDAYETFGVEQGAPANEICGLAWCNDRLYIAYKDALASFDPVKKSFTLIASSVSLESKNVFDGHGSFLFTYLIADESHNALWFNIQEDALNRELKGLWRYDTKTGKFQHVGTDHSRASWDEAGLFVHLSKFPSPMPLAQPWAQLDFDKSELARLEDYAPYMPLKDSGIQVWNFVRVGEHIIAANGQLYTPDGKIHRMKSDEPWFHLARIGEGFITHHDPKSNTLWYLAPKKP